MVWTAVVFACGNQLPMHLFLFIYLFFKFVVNFVIHWNETSLSLHVFPIPIPPATSLSTRSLQVLPEHQVRALVSCIQPGLEICFTRFVFHLTRWRDVWILCGDPSENHSSQPHLDRGPRIPWHLKRLMEFNASKRDEAWHFLKIDRNPNISVETRKGRLISQFT